MAKGNLNKAAGQSAKKAAEEKAAAEAAATKAAEEKAAADAVANKSSEEAAVAEAAKKAAEEKAAAEAAAEAAAQSAGASKTTKVPALSVVSTREGFRRGGRAWSKEETVVKLSDLSDEQIAQIKGEALLTVTEVEVDAGVTE